MAPNGSQLTLDKEMTRLVQLCSQPSHERDVDSVLKIVNNNAPNLLNGLAMSNNRNIARTLEIRTYVNDEVVFLQNAPPDAYYTVLRGAVSIYALVKDVTHSAQDMVVNKRLQYGKFLVQLRNGAGFGELSFNGDFNHTPRNAGVVSDGSGSQALSGVDGSDDEDDMCVMLLIPEKTYMSEMYALHASKNQTKDKIKFLKRSFLFNSWSMDELVKLAYALKKKEFSRGENLAKQGDRSESVYLIIKGKVKLSINSSTNLQNASGEKIGTTNKIVEVAELIDGDIAGLVECLGSKRKMERSISTVGGGVEVFVVNMVNFEIMLKQVPKTFKLVEKVVQKRKQWEKMRTDYAANFPMMKCSLPDNAVEMSKYRLSRESTMSDAEFRVLNEKKNALFHLLREARSNYRTAVTKLKVKNVSAALQAFSESRTKCGKALLIAEDIQDSDLVAQAEDIMEEVKEQMEIYNSGGGIGKQISGGVGKQISGGRVGTKVSGGVGKQTSPPRLSSRRGSATLVAMRIRTLSVDSDRASGSEDDNSPAVSVDRRGGSPKKSEMPLSPDTLESINMQRSRRRSSIAELAEKAGLKKEWGEMDKKREADTVTMKSPGGAVKNLRRGSLATKKKEDSFYHLLKRPSPPSNSRERSSRSRRESGNSVRRKRSVSDTVGGVTPLTGKASEGGDGKASGGREKGSFVGKISLGIKGAIKKVSG